MVVDLEKEKEGKVEDWTLAMLWPDGSSWVQSIIGGGALLAKKAKERPDAGPNSSVAFGHFFRIGELARSDA